jgi:hypothetical protein
VGRATGILLGVIPAHPKGRAIIPPGDISMTHTFLSRLAGVLIIVALTAVVSGCKKDEPPADTQEPQARAESDAGATADAKDAAKDEANTSAEVEAKLAAADAVDGNVDKIIAKCPGCSLGMDGSSKHPFETAGYTLHFCAAGCKEQFTKDATKSILALKIPEDGE